MCVCGGGGGGGGGGQVTLVPFCRNWHFVTFEKNEIKGLASNSFITISHMELKIIVHLSVSMF